MKSAGGDVGSGALRTLYEQHFGRPPEGVWAAPGRVNLIGEHTDYNDGFMLPLAIPQGVVALAGRNTDGLVRAVSVQETGAASGAPGAPGPPAGAPAVVPLEDLTPGSVDGWAAYVAGVVWSLREAGHPVEGVDILVDGDVPSGAGLSSSAALECSTGLALVDLYDVAIARPALARLAQRAENDFVGMPCGILDQSASLLCTADHLLFLDARTLETEEVPFDLGSHHLELLVIDTRAPHRHVDGEYAARRRACEDAARLLGVDALRDLESLPSLDDPVLQRRVRHVFTENARVLETISRLRTGGPRTIGDLLTASHLSLRDDYEVTVPELDTAVDAALSAGALGARMTGGGFGGCVIALADSDLAGAVRSTVAGAFADKGLADPAFFTAHPAPGARRLA